MPIGMTPEWAEQAYFWLVWPSRNSDWAPMLRAIRQTYLECVAAVSPTQAVLLCVDSVETQNDIQADCQARGINTSNIHYCIGPTDDTWIRDFSPITLDSPSGRVSIQFTFNGWGNKYPHAQDAALSARCHATCGIPALPSQQHPLQLEGGNLESDGKGTVLVSKSSLLTGRNPGMTLAAISQQLQTALLARQVCIIENINVQGDDTDGHIDNVARFVNEKTLLYMHCEDKHDPHFAVSERLEAQVRALVNAEGETYTCIKVPLPNPIYNTRGERLPASYLNFVITNKVVLVPQFNDPNDKRVHTLLSELFPSRHIVPIDSTTLIQQYGGLHCASAAIFKALQP